MNQDLRRFSGHIPIIFEELNIFSRVKIVKLQQEENKLQLKWSKIEIEMMFW